MMRSNRFATTTERSSPMMRQRLRCSNVSDSLEPELSIRCGSHTARCGTRPTSAFNISRRSCRPNGSSTGTPTARSGPSPAGTRPTRHASRAIPVQDGPSGRGSWKFKRTPPGEDTSEDEVNAWLAGTNPESAASGPYGSPREPSGAAVGIPENWNNLSDADKDAAAEAMLIQLGRSLGVSTEPDAHAAS